MGQHLNSLRLLSPVWALVALETSLFIAMPYLATLVLSQDLSDIELPSIAEAVCFALTLVAALGACGLYRFSIGHRMSAELVRSAWAFTVAGGLLVLVSEYLPFMTQRLSVTVLGLLIGFFVQRTVRVVFLDMVSLPPK